MKDQANQGSRISFGHRPLVQTLKLVGGHAYLAPWLWRGFARTGHGLRALLCANPELADCGLPTAPKLSRYGAGPPFLPSLIICRPMEDERVNAFAHEHSFPLVMKPLFGSRSRSVCKIHSMDELLSRTIGEPMIIQPFIDLPKEYGINVSRLNGTLRIYSITEVDLREPASGDRYGRTLRLGRTNGFRDVTDHVSEPLTRACDDAAARIGLNFGRFDVKAESLGALREGRFRILEANGPLAVNLSFYDDGIPVRERIETLRTHWEELFRHARRHVTIDTNATQVLRNFIRYFVTPRRYATSLRHEVNYRDLATGT